MQLIQVVYFGYFAFPAQLFDFCVLNYCLFVVVCLLTLFSRYFSLTPSQTLYLLSEFSLNPLSHIRFHPVHLFERKLSRVLWPLPPELAAHWNTGAQAPFTSHLYCIPHVLTSCLFFLFFFLGLFPHFSDACLQANVLVLVYLKIPRFPLSTWKDFSSYVLLSPNFQSGYLEVQGHSDCWFFKGGLSLSL